MTLRNGKRRFLSGAQPRVPDIERTERAGGSGAPVKTSGNDAYAAGTFREIHLRNACIEDGLIAGRRHFMLSRQVDPELRHLQNAPAARKRRGMKLLMQDPRRRG